jgi:proline iminopeptidase
MDSLMATDFNSLEPGKQLIKQYVAAAPKYFYNPRFDCTAVWDKVSVNMNFFNHYFGKLIANRDNSEAYKSLQVPALIISGKYDFICPHILWDGIVEEIPNAKYVLFENTGHNPMLEIPDEFTQTILDWVESLK